MSNPLFGSCETIKHKIFGHTVKLFVIKLENDLISFSLKRKPN